MQAQAFEHKVQPSVMQAVPFVWILFCFHFEMLLPFRAGTDV